MGRGSDATDNMCALYILLITLIISANALKVDNRNAFDQDLYERVLDPAECKLQLLLLRNHSLGLQFIDASGRVPSGVTGGHIADLGEYYRCLDIKQFVDTHDIKGKYCTMRFPFDENPIVIPEMPEFPEFPELPDLPDIPWPDLPWPPRPDNETREMLRQYTGIKQWAHMISGAGQPIESRIFPLFSVDAGLTLGVCVPEVCTPTEAVNFFQEQIPFLNLTFSEFYCRLPNDKPFSAADYVAMTIFSILAVITLISSSYDLYQLFVLKRDTTEVNKLYRSFSVYTNTSRFLNLKSPPGALECIDGIRAISMLWVIVGHTYSLTLLGFLHNLRDMVDWISSYSAVWVNASPMTVDTFFMLSGILCVYTTVGQISRGRFVRSLHLFYLNRLLRMTPLLAAVILLQASVLHHATDGPFWQNVAHAAVSCREYWWSALLHIQNYVNPTEICLYQSWYLSVDVQLYLACPLVLFWLFGASLFAWCALATVTVMSLVASTAYSFTYNFTASLNNPARLRDFSDYLQIYYVNTLTRASPFCVGMVYGYLLHLYRGRRIRLPKIYLCCLWTLAFVMMTFCVFSIYPVSQTDHTAQGFDNFLNAYMRAIWASAVGWMILACTHGFGGPINWFLSLRMWKLPARLSYAMYLIHLPIIVTANGAWMKTHYFTDGETLYRYAGDVLFSFVFAFVLCITIDAPFSTLQKLLMSRGKKPTPKQVTESRTSIVNNEKCHIKTTL